MKVVIKESLKQNWPKKKYGLIVPLLLTGIFILLVIFSFPDGCLYGSNTDWYSQHVTLAETIRKSCLEMKTLAPAWLPLGGGSNGYQFSYYGYFRPDILIGCLLPNVSMEVIVPVYILTGYLLSVLLMYRWLLDEGLEPFFSFAGSTLFMLAGCFFHTHRQIMFVNYMPFLIFALMMIRKKKYALVCISLFLVYIHSFYYAIACLAVIAWYWYRREGKKFIKRFLAVLCGSAGMAMMLLLPSFLTILEYQHNGERAVTMADLFAPDLDFGSLLYGPYGMGLTMLCLYLLLLGLESKKSRISSALFLFLALFGVGSWILNGTLYARAKILIPFVPVVILHCIFVLRRLHKKEMQWRIWPFAVIGLVLLLERSSDQWGWMLADAGIVCLIVCKKRFEKAVPDTGSAKNMVRSGRRRRYFSDIKITYGWYQFFLIIPFFVFVNTASSESWVKIPERSAFSEEELEQLCNDPLYRTESIADCVNECNALSFAGQQKMTMYSSVTNPAYNRAYYDLLATPIQINNRTAILAEENPFLLQLMGVKYLITTEDKVPSGYQVIARKGDDVIVENPSVLPMAYTTSACMGTQQYELLDDIGKLEAISRYTIVPEEIKSYEPSKKYEDINGYELSDHYEIKEKEDRTITLELDERLSDILLIRFQVNNKDGKAVVITINGIKNKLAADSAPYPNDNHLFSYQLSEPDGMDKITIQLSKGNYDISDIEVYAFPTDLFGDKQIIPAVMQEEGKEADSHTMLSCQVQAREDDYFVTSIPIQKGMHLFVDGVETGIETVNQVFAGAKLEEGTHEIELKFYPPGQRMGYAVSLVSGSVFLGFWRKHR